LSKSGIRGWLGLALGALADITVLVPLVDFRAQNNTSKPLLFLALLHSNQIWIVDY
jgi:hypothetical protein